MMRQVPGWPILAVVAVLIAVIAVTVFKTPEIDNVIAWLFIGAALMLLGAWVTLMIQEHSRPGDSRIDDD
jgi:uncharacterized membrane protein HdeD (DUF308 family)